MELDRNEVHDDAIRAAELNPDFLLERYCAMPRSHGGRYVGADLFKELFPKFSASPEGRNRYNNPVHNAAAVLASAQFQMNLDDVPEKNSTSVIMLTGIPGAGKTSFVFTNGQLDDGLRMVYEGQLSNPVTSIKKSDKRSMPTWMFRSLLCIRCQKRPLRTRSRGS